MARGRIGWYSVAMTALLAATVLVRLPSIGADLGHQPPDIDGHRLAASIRHYFLTGSIEYRTVEHYPGIVFWAMSASSLGLFMWGLMRGAIRAIEFTTVEQFMLAGRLTNVAAAAGLVWCTAALARRMSGRSAAIVAALVVAFAPLSIETTTDMRNDPGQVLLLVAAVLAAVVALGHAERRSIVVAGACAGLATGVKYTSVFVLVPVLIAAVSGDRDRRTGRALAGVLSFAVALAVSNHYIWWDFANFLRQLSDQVNITGSGHWAASANPPAFHRMVLATVGPGWPLLVIAAGFGAWGLATGARRAWLFWSFPILYSWFTTHRPSQFARWVFPLLPFVAIAGACGLVAIVDGVRRAGAWRRVARPALASDVAAALVVLLAVGPPLWAGAGTISRRLTPTTAAMLESWLAKRVVPGQVVLAENGWLDLGGAPFRVMRVPDLHWALGAGRQALGAADLVVVPEPNFADPGLAGLPLVGTITATQRAFGGHLGFDYRVYAVPALAPTETVDLSLGDETAVAALGWGWDRRARGPGLPLPDRSAAVYAPPLTRTDATLDIDLAGPGEPASSAVPVVVTVNDAPIVVADAQSPGPGIRRLTAHVKLMRPGRAIAIRLDPIRPGARLRVLRIRLS